RERAAAEEAADAAIEVILDGIREEESSDTPYHAALSAAWCVRLFSPDAPYDAGHAAFYAAATEGTKNSALTILRCTFGNPFRPVTLNAASQTPTVLALAQAAYENRILPAGTLEPARLAVLADALEEAGCNNHDILNHL